MKVNIAWIDDLGQEFIGQSVEVTDYEDALDKINLYHNETVEEAKDLVEGFDDLEHLALFAESTDKNLDNQLLNSSEIDELGL
jgi:hypothetical protein